MGLNESMHDYEICLNACQCLLTAPAACIGNGRSLEVPVWPAGSLHRVLRGKSSSWGGPGAAPNTRGVHSAGG